MQSSRVRFMTPELARWPYSHQEFRVLWEGHTHRVDIFHWRSPRTELLYTAHHIFPRRPDLSEPEGTWQVTVRWNGQELPLRAGQDVRASSSWREFLPATRRARKDLEHEVFTHRELSGAVDSFDRAIELAHIAEPLPPWPFARGTNSWYLVATSGSHEAWMAGPYLTQRIARRRLPDVKARAEARFGDDARRVSWHVRRVDTDRPIEVWFPT